jgi:alpha-1,3-glucosyltransferase
MRATVLVSEFLIYIPAVVIFNRRLANLMGVSIWESSVALAAILMQPATLLIDHGHFQYNTVMLGFVVSSISSMLAGRLLWSCVFFVGALAFKQMALYFAPAIFAYLLGICIYPRINPLRLTAIAVVTALSFAAVFAPLLVVSVLEYHQNPKALAALKASYLYDTLHSALPASIRNNYYVLPALLQLTQAIHRIFPLARGLFEDKVANIWCALNTVYKLNKLPLEFLSRLSLLATLAAALPSCIVLFLRPRKAILPYALASCAWAFFLLSFQVHEKSVLLPLLPMTLLLGGREGLGPEMRAWVGWANILGCWTMFPLLKRDELRIPYITMTLLWAYLLGLPPTSFSLYFTGGSLTLPTKLLHLGFYLAMPAWHILEALVPPPAGKPDLWVVLNCVLGAVGFGICYLWCTWNAISRSGLVPFGKWGALTSVAEDNTQSLKKKTASGNNTGKLRDQHS